MGKTSVPSSRLNIPGRIGWLTMEVPGFLTLLYHLRTLPSQIHPSLHNNNPDPDSNYEGLPYQTKILASLFVLHYTYRALLFPFLQPSMSPIHAAVWLAAASFQVVNGLAIGSWLAGYGPTATAGEWAARVSTGQFAVGLGVFYLGLMANYYHDDELREIRRRAGRRARARAAAGKGEGKEEKGVDKHYEIPEAGLFKVMLYPHYFMEWVEWFGFWMAAGWGCVPARCFLFNEIAAMLPRAVSGRRWYAEKFGEERIKGRWAVIPGVC
jgi:3-oxo-5-alpha-steroid 4-dehydrogenase 1